MRNAYVLVYKRKLTDDSLLITDEVVEAVGISEGSSNPAAAPSKYKLGQQELQLVPDSRLNQKI